MRPIRSPITITGVITINTSNKLLGMWRLLLQTTAGPKL
jgi:hypothetical protein